jgi:hypothetical protein
MGRSREEVQDIALYHMEKSNRRNKGAASNEPESLEEGMNRLDKLASMSPEERQRMKTWGDWCDDLRDFMLKNRTWSQRNYTFVMAKYNAEMMKFHADGTSYREVVSFIEEKSVERLNW